MNEKKNIFQLNSPLPDYQAFKEALKGSPMGELTITQREKLQALADLGNPIILHPDDARLILETIKKAEHDAARHKENLSGVACEVCLTISWVPIEYRDDADGVNVKRGRGGTLSRCDYCWCKWTCDYHHLPLIQSLITVSEDLINGLQCDHDVGICCCGEKHIINEAKRIFKKDKT